MNNQMNTILSNNLNKIKLIVNDILKNTDINQFKELNIQNINCLETLYVINDDKEFQIGIYIDGMDNDNKEFLEYIKQEVKKKFDFSNVVVVNQY